MESAVSSLLEQCAASSASDLPGEQASLFEHDTALNFDPARLTRHMSVNVAAPVLLARQLHARIADGGQGS